MQCFTDFKQNKTEKGVSQNKTLLKGAFYGIQEMKIRVAPFHSTLLSTNSWLH